MNKKIQAEEEEEENNETLVNKGSSIRENASNTVCVQ